MDDADFFEELKKDFIDEALFLSEQCEESYLQLDDPDKRQDELAKIFRVAHSIKGGGAAVGFVDLSSFAHVVEDLLAVLRVRTDLVNPEVVNLLLKAGDAMKERLISLRDGNTEEWNAQALKNTLKAKTIELEGGAPAVAIALVAPEVSEKKKANSGAKGRSAIKVDPEKVDSILDLVGELVVLKSQLWHQIDAEKLKESGVESLFDRTIRDLQRLALSMRMTSMKSLFTKLQRIVRDVSQQLDKKVDLELVGEGTELDRNMIEVLSDPLVHLVRNSLDHGLEDQDGRMASGKSDMGKLVISAYQKGDRINIEIQDDGRGVDRDKVLKKAIEKGLVAADAVEVDKLSILDLLTLPGFSTAQKVTDLSGRGVGLDVVKNHVEELRGHLEMETQVGIGTLFRLSLPLTTSITDGLLVRVKNQKFILPLDRTKELMGLDHESIKKVSSQTEVIKIRDRLIPVIDLGEELSGIESLALKEPAIGASQSRRDVVVIVQSQGRDLAVRVHQVLGQNQVVLKPLSGALTATGVFSGSAIMGDGNVALIIDVEGLGHRTPSDIVEEEALPA